MVIENCGAIRDIVSTELPAIMTRLQSWWTTWDEIHMSESSPNPEHARVPRADLLFQIMDSMQELFSEVA